MVRPTVKEARAALAVLGAFVEAGADVPPPVVPPVVVPPVKPPVVPPSSALLEAFTIEGLRVLTAMERPSAAGDWTTWASAPEKDRAYYGPCLGLLRMHRLTGEARYLAAAKREGAAYVKTLVFSADRKMCWPVQREADGKVGVVNWKPGTLPDPDDVRRWYAIDLEQLFRVTSDLTVREAALGLATSMLSALPLLEGKAGSPPMPRIEWTERSLAYPIYALTAGARLDPARFAARLADLVNRAIAWNARSPDGNFCRDSRADPGELEVQDPLRGGSPFMTALLVDALVEAAPQDPRVAAVVGRVSDWLAKQITQDTNQKLTDRTSYKYLVGGISSQEYERGYWPDLCTMIASAHFHAHRLTGEVRHKAVGEEMLAVGLDVEDRHGSRQGVRSPKKAGQFLTYGARCFSAE